MSKWTKDGMIQNHRVMYQWMSQQSLAQKRNVNEREALEHFGWKGITLNMWGCEYSEHRCYKCPFAWPNVVFGVNDWGVCVGSLYGDTALLSDKDYVKLSKMYKQIAELPLRGV